MKASTQKGGVKEDTKGRKMAWQGILTACIVVLLVANILLTARVLVGMERLKPGQREPLPCQAVPIRFVMDEPECADKLLRSMNVSNVRVLARGIS